MQEYIITTCKANSTTKQKSKKYNPIIKGRYESKISKEIKGIEMTTIGINKTKKVYIPAFMLNLSLFLLILSPLLLRFCNASF
jgi:hypothetical protein